MSTQITLEYLSKLLNKPVTEQIEIILSSAQKSRVHGWLIKNGISFNESALAGKFTIDQLLFGGIREATPQPHSQSSVSSLAQLDVRNLQIGVDIQRVDELFPQGLSSDPKSDQELTQIFTIKELSYAQSKIDPEVTLTGIFCAKEAIQKTSNIAKNLIEIEVLPDESGRPQSNGYALSISHSGNYAISVAVGNNQQIPALKNFESSIDDAQIVHPPKKYTDFLFGVRIVDIFLLGSIVFLGYTQLIRH